MSRLITGYDVSGGPDSAVLRHGEPVFVADPADDWLSMVCPAIVIDLLGTHIPLSCVRRHYSRGMLTLLTLPRSSPHMPPLFHDRAIAPGAQFAAEELENTITVTRSNIDGSNPALWTDRGLSLGEADRAVTYLSQFMTLKTGDIIAFESLPLALGAPVLDTRITARAGDTPSLDVKIK